MDRRLRPCSNLVKMGDSKLQSNTLLLSVMRFPGNLAKRGMLQRAEVLVAVFKTVSVTRNFANTKEELNTVEE